jgi:hypothetical protein
MNSEVFSKYKKSATIFIETGTYRGDAIVSAQQAGFEECYSIEFNPDFWFDAIKRFNGSKDVTILLGSSEEKLAEIMPSINERCLFWLDAHDTFGTGGGVPTYSELEVLKNHNIKNHTLIIDDVPLYFGDGESLRQKILEINKDYKIEMISNGVTDAYILVACIND